MGSDVLSEILKWSEDQPAWQRDALRRLFAAGALTDEDGDELLLLCKAPHGLLADPAGGSPAEPLAKEHLAISEEQSAPITLRQVTHHRGVNALAQEQTVQFGPQLTVVFGHNAAGKSGFTRILKR